MAKRKGQVVNNTLVTPDTLCTFPVVDVNDIAGGRLIVASYAERNSIPPKFRKEGMVVRVQGTVKKDFELKPGFSANGALTDNDWKDYTTAIPDGVLTAHQKVEDMQYQTAVAISGGTTTSLVTKLADLESLISNCLTSHQKVEDMEYQTAVSITGGSTTSLIAKLADMDSKIASAASPQHIEDIDYLNTPASPDTHGHKTNLADELENIYTKMNVPANISVTRYGAGTTTDLQTILNEIGAKLGHVLISDVYDSSGNGLAGFLTTANNAVDQIQWSPASGSTSAMSLKQKIEALDSAISAVEVEDVTWGTTPTSIVGGLARSASLSAELNTLFTEIDKMNKPANINVRTSASDATAIDLQTKLNNIDSAITSAGLTPNIESIVWGTTPASVVGGLSRNESLKVELNTLFSAVETINTTIADMNDPTKIILNSTASPQVTLSDFYTSMSDNDKVEHITWGTTPTASTIVGGLARSASLSSEINTLFSTVESINGAYNKPANIKVLLNPTATPADSTTTDLQTKLTSLETTAGAPTVESIKWATTQSSLPGGLARDDDLSVELNALFAKVPDINDPTLINVLKNPDDSSDTSTVTLAQKLAAIQAGQYCPQYLLYNTSAPETGALTSQEFLTTYASQICEIAVYTNADATITGDIEIKLEKCESSSTTYSDVTGTSITLSSSASGLMNRTSFTSLTTPITIPDNCRLRLNIVTYNTANVVDVLNVRVKLMQYVSA